jgi:DEAD/DEAH box helicase domain-containing protein
MTIDQLIEQLSTAPDFAPNVTAWRLMPPRLASYGEWPAGIDPRLVQALAQRGIHRPYTHQAQAIEAALAGQDVVVVTGTASGKTLCYNAPVLQAILQNPSSRALYLFPTKALSQDQYTELHELIGTLGVDVKTYTYDGDTPPSARRAIRLAGHIVVTNPDMLHTGILPHHTRWQRLFEHLQFVVVDELHQYRGIFGSHVANVLRRLQRLCAWYGARPQFICCSATIGNPAELARRLTGRDAILVDNDGAARGARHVIFYNPPAINRELGLRQSAIDASARLARRLLANDVQTIVFARSRVATEVLLARIRDGLSLPPAAVRGYRGGYLPRQRREIEQGLRRGEVRGVVATNALELGIDIGQLEAAILCGYPGTIASTWQQAGRAGRRTSTSLAILVAGSSPLDQFVVSHPDYFFGRSPENALVNPDNLFVLMGHLPCAAFELPFREGETYGEQDAAGLQQALQWLEEGQTLQREGDTWHWAGMDYPAERVSLRAATRENVVIIDVTDPKPTVIGECDPFAAPMLVHRDAIYLHEGQQYHIVDLDWAQKKAYGRRVDVDYYTDASLSLNIAVLEDEGRADLGPVEKAWGEVRLTFTPTIYKKLRLHTHENVGWGTIDLPPQEMQTTACWLACSEALARTLGTERLQRGLVGLSHVLQHVAPLFLMCDPRDVVALPVVKDPFTARPTVYLCDYYPGGVGLAQKLYTGQAQVLEAARQLVAACGCAAGCPSCAGPPGEGSDKESTLALLEAMLSEQT